MPCYLSRAEVPPYIAEKFGKAVAPTAKTLGKWASQGGGPAITYFGRRPCYNTEDVNSWVLGRLRGPYPNTAAATIAPASWESV